MGQRATFILAAVLTGFLLVAVGAVAGRVVDAGAAPAAPAPTAAPTAELLTAMQQRDAAYRQLIAEANARLQQLSAGPADTQTTYPITPARALLIATSATGGSLVRLPELVNVQGTVAYEVILTSGTFYVDATTGKLLTNNTAPVVTVVRSSGGGHEHEHEHEGGGDD
ncbi:MAG TPA: PepSY domain-containing protein [Anaerolineales bacterium]|nr:PepSY domain-containing protein [Anaerolineales bacterium]